MGNSNKFIQQLGGEIMQQFNEIMPTLKADYLYNSSDVARICKLVSTATYFSEVVKKGKDLSLQDKNMIRNVNNITEYIDAALTGREPFQAISVGIEDEYTL